jgi:hypothetical protein
VNTSNAFFVVACTTMLLRTGATCNELTWGLLSRIRAFRFFLECLERVRPELIEPATQRAESVGIDPIHPAGPLRAIDHEAGLLERLEVLGDSWAADGDSCRNRTHGGRPGTQRLEYGAPGGVGQGG